MKTDWTLMLRELGIPQEQVTLTEGGRGIALRRDNRGFTLRVEQPSMAGRALSLLLEHRDAPEGFCVQETPAFSRLGVMLDCSRNAVPTVDTLRRFIRMLSLMGYNELQLYMEDIYTLEDYPYFGYGRGAYTDDELRALDAYAAAFGIELVPAIQTLAHQGQALKWDAMREYVDVGDILLADEEKTYRFIEAMFSKMRRCLHTGRINIGMDEAHLLGLGKYLSLHGYTDRMKLLLRHFERVHALANRYGFKPMLWSDMFFRLATGGAYYKPDCTIDPSVGAHIPQDTSLIYWDYYSLDRATYDGMLERHMQITPHTIFAAGAWKWSGYSPCNHFSLTCAREAFPACVAHGVDEVLVTMWGDNGAECSLFAVLPTLQAWAEMTWRGEAAEAALAGRFTVCTGGCLADFLALDEPVFTPDNPCPGRCSVNATKTLLYEDVLTPLFSHRMDVAGYAAHLRPLEDRFARAAQDAQWAWLFDCDRAMCALLRRKCELQAVLRPAWARRDRETLARLCEQELPALCEAVEAFTAALHRRWLHENKAPGLDVLDLRLGGLLQRCRTARERLLAWLSGEIATVEELDMPLLPYSAQAEKQGHADCYAPAWHLIASPEGIASI